VYQYARSYDNLLLKIYIFIVPSPYSTSL